MPGILGENAQNPPNARAFGILPGPGENLGYACPCLAFCLFLSLPANALFLAGQAEQGGVISILCEGQGKAFVSSPSGELRALSLDLGFQAKFFPQASGPHTIQCGNETVTIFVSLPARADSGAYSSGENIIIVSGVAIAFIAALLLAAKFFLKPGTIFQKSVSGGRVRLFLRAGPDLHGIKISDPQGGDDGAPIVLSIPHLPAGAEWGWEYERKPGEPLLAASLSAKGEAILVSCVEGGGVPAQKAGDMAKTGKRKLKRAVQPGAGNPAE